MVVVASARIPDEGTCLTPERTDSLMDLIAGTPTPSGDAVTAHGVMAKNCMHAALAACIAAVQKSRLKSRSPRGRSALCSGSDPGGSGGLARPSGR